MPTKWLQEWGNGSKNQVWMTLDGPFVGPQSISHTLSLTLTDPLTRTHTPSHNRPLSHKHSFAQTLLPFLPLP